VKAGAAVVVVPAAMGGFTVFECPERVAISWSSRDEVSEFKSLAGKGELAEFLDRHFADWKFHAEGK